MLPGSPGRRPGTCPENLLDNLDIADDAEFTDQPLQFSIGAENDADADVLRRNIGAMRESGEPEEIVARTRLE